MNPMNSQSFVHASASFAWNAASFKSAAEYIVKLDDADRGQIMAAVNALDGSAAISDVPKQHFAFGTLAQKLATAAKQVRSGHGFVILRGLPIDGLDIDQYTAAVCGVGHHFGFTLSQNAQGERVTFVVDASAVDPTPRMYRSNLELRPHSDITAMIALACWHKSQSGGASVVVSGVTVHDEIRRRAPHLLEPLYRGYHYHRLGEEGEGEAPATEQRVPVFANRNGQLSVRYQRAGIAGGQREMNLALDAQDIEALNLFDEIASAPENRLAFFLERGDMMVVNNYTVMHARTRFVNFPEPERRRQLVRLWLDDARFRDVPPAFNFFRANGVPKQTGKCATYDFKKLYANDPLATGGVPDLKVTDAEALATTLEGN